MGLGRDVGFRPAALNEVDPSNPDVLNYLGFFHRKLDQFILPMRMNA